MTRSINRHLLAGFVMAALAGGAAVAQAGAVKVQTFPFSDPSLDLGAVHFKGGKTLHLHQGIGSAAFHPPGSAVGTFVTLGDRGPNFVCKDAKEIVGVPGRKICGKDEDGRIYPTPDYSPSIYRIMVDDDGVRLLSVTTLKDSAGRPVSGLPNPMTVATTEKAFDADGKKLPQSAAAVDAEGIVALKDGTFWIGEENATSILHVAADGRILLRVVPEGTEGDFAAAGYPVKGGLPAILARRMANRGVESMAVSPDERFLFFVLQNPLANPDAKAFEKARNTRLFKVDAATGKPVAEYVYELTPMSRFKGEEKEKASKARISELLAIDADHFLIDDRTDKTTLIFKLYLAGATNILGGRFDDPKTSPSLEETSLATARIQPVGKVPLLDSNDFPDLPRKIEGMAFFGGEGRDGQPALMLINDDDFGIEGDETVVARVSGLPIRP